MADEKLVGINEAKLDSLILQIGEIAERINNKFNLIEQLISETSSYFQCEIGTNYRLKFNGTKSNFEIVNKNILNMAADLVNVKSMMQKTNANAIDYFQQSAAQELSNSLNKYERKN